MENTWNFSPSTSSPFISDSLYKLAISTRQLNTTKGSVTNCRLGEFKPVTHAAMKEIWPYLSLEKGRTTDFSYAGVLMWVDYFKYEYVIYDDTLFIKGVVENDMSVPAFSLPIGKLSLKDSVELLKEYCEANNLRLEFSAVPEYAIEEMKALNPIRVEPLTDWGDYLYDAQMLATVAGKKMSKKRNHVSQFRRAYPEWKAVEITPENADIAMKFMDVFDLEGDSTEMARAERELSRGLISMIKEGDKNLEGMILYAGDTVGAYTIGDVKGDTLFVHVEKATRSVNSSYEMINYVFAKHMTEKYPEIKYINREDDAGDMGLRMAKESYHPLEILKKYNIVF
ncbi:MAG: DUF2156 domain-containing protein [Bacteroides sp.]|nr:DUF2156 domain-containing protein [Bacteroides sp.]